MTVLEGLKPEKVFYFFEKLCEIPHGSTNMKEISDYLVSFAKERNLKYYQDEAYNVVIYKEASAGYEDAPILFYRDIVIWLQKRHRIQIMILQKMV